MTYNDCEEEGLDQPRKNEKQIRIGGIRIQNMKRDEVLLSIVICCANDYASMMPSVPTNKITVCHNIKRYQEGHRRYLLLFYNITSRSHRNQHYKNTIPSI